MFYGYLITVTDKDGNVYNFYITDQDIALKYQRTLSFGFHLYEIEAIKIATNDQNAFVTELADESIPRQLYDFFQPLVDKAPLNLSVNYYGFAKIYDDMNIDEKPYDLAPENMFQTQNFIKTIIDKPLLGEVKYDITPMPEGYSEVCQILFIHNSAAEATSHETHDTIQIVEEEDY